MRGSNSPELISFPGNYYGSYFLNWWPISFIVVFFQCLSAWKSFWHIINHCWERVNKILRFFPEKYWLEWQCIVDSLSIIDWGVLTIVCQNYSRLSLTRELNSIFESWVSNHSWQWKYDSCLTALYVFWPNTFPQTETLAGDSFPTILFSKSFSCFCLNLPGLLSFITLQTWAWTVEH